MKEIKIKTPAKINLTLEILNKRNDGYHNIQSIMQTISLYDTLIFKKSYKKGLKINLDGTSKKIPYDKKNLVYKAAVKFFEKTKITDAEISIFIDKNIPVEAGLAGGSTNAAGTVYALNKLYDNILNSNSIDEICAELGSDVNFCFKGGCALCSSRGEIIKPLPVYIQKVSLIKPKNVSISTKEAYKKFSELNDKANSDNTTKLEKLILQRNFDESLLYNSFEKALLKDFKELQEIKNKVQNSLMTGSGSAFFVLKDKIETVLDKKNYEIFENLSTIENGVFEA